MNLFLTCRISIDLAVAPRFVLDNFTLLPQPFAIADTRIPTVAIDTGFIRLTVNVQIASCSDLVYLERFHTVLHNGCFHPVILNPVLISYLRQLQHMHQMDFPYTQERIHTSKLHVAVVLISN